MLYIDKLKALAMLLVIMGHTIYFCMNHEKPANDPVLNIICTFHVPLFFFLSGFVIKQPPVGLKLLHKVRRFMIPMLVVGFLNALLIGKVSDFFLTSGHNGYWYLLTLTIFYLLLSLFLINRLKKRIYSFLIDVIMAGLLWLVLIKVFKLFNQPCDPFNLGSLYSFWPYFIAGYLIRIFGFEKFIIDKPWLTVILLFCYLMLLLAYYSHLNEPSIYVQYAIAFTAIAALLALFHHFEESHTFFDRQLSFIGNNTLDIYVYHYFFIRFISLDFLKSQSLIVELLVTISLTILIAYGSMGIGHLVQRGLSLITNRNHIN